MVGYAFNARLVELLIEGLQFLTAKISIGRRHWNTTASRNASFGVSNSNISQFAVSFVSLFLRVNWFFTLRIGWLKLKWLYATPVGNNNGNPQQNDSFELISLVFLLFTKPVFPISYFTAYRRHKLRTCNEEERKGEIRFMYDTEPEYRKSGHIGGRRVFSPLRNPCYPNN